MGKCKPVEPKNKTERYQIRCTEQELKIWDAYSRVMGFGSTGAWLGRIANERIKSLEEQGSPFVTQARAFTSGRESR